MLLKPFSVLTEKERAGLLAFMSRLSAKSPYPDQETMAKSLSASGFDGGRSFLTAWSDEGAPLGTVGVVRKEIPARGEAFLTSLYLEPERSGLLAGLLAEVYKMLAAVDAPPTTIVRLVLRTASEHLRAPALAAGFRECYRLLEMRLSSLERPQPGAAVAFTPVSAESVRDFVAVHNAAFLRSPNGSQISVAEAEESMAEAALAGLMQVGYVGGAPVAMFELHLEEDAGMIDGLGVHPDYQGRGFGRASLRQAVATLLARRVPEVRLQVVDANLNALALYQSEGFVPDKVVATVFAATLGEAVSRAELS